MQRQTIGAHIGAAKKVKHMLQPLSQSHASGSRPSVHADERTTEKHGEQNAHMQASHADASGSPGHRSQSVVRHSSPTGTGREDRPRLPPPSREPPLPPLRVSDARGSAARALEDRCEVRTFFSFVRTVMKP
eukprot:Amastigsp_a509241_255.p2 type:complete len:132 gc:universal Amastigsp_a509241_255:418-23(-)